MYEAIIFILCMVGRVALDELSSSTDDYAGYDDVEEEERVEKYEQ